MDREESRIERGGPPVNYMGIFHCVEGCHTTSPCVVFKGQLYKPLLVIMMLITLFLKM